MLILYQRLAYQALQEPNGLALIAVAGLAIAGPIAPRGDAAAMNHLTADPASPAPTAGIDPAQPEGTPVLAVDPTKPNETPIVYPNGPASTVLLTPIVDPVPPPGTGTPIVESSPPLGTATPIIEPPPPPGTATPIVDPVPPPTTPTAEPIRACS
ncbi:hypothetical protein PWT90_00479 [Aphanocladium album]|nr:hypothetical protein PWT90_00479 [Aphanocladium album]